MRVVLWQFFFLLIISVFGSKGQSKEAKPCSDEYVVVVAESPRDRMKPTIFGTGTLFSEFYGTGMGPRLKLKELIDKLNEHVEECVENPSVIIVYPQQPVPAKPPPSTVINEYHISNYFINKETYDVSVNEINVYDDVINIVVKDTNHHDEKHEIFTQKNRRSIRIAGVEEVINGKLLARSKNGPPNKAKLVFVFRLEESIFSIMPNIKLVKLPVPRYRARVSSWPSDWPWSQNKRGRKPHCKGFTTFDFGAATNQTDVIFTDSKGTPLELKCFVDQKGNGGDFSNCGTPWDGPILCGDLQVGILTGKNTCQNRSRASGDHKSVDYVPMESMFDFVVDFMENKNAVTTNTESVTGFGILPYSNVFLIVARIIFLIF
ncbi:unnamed protein product [Ceutorhynchus assimilis]|uniref:Peptidase S1 domain-containing protein n=1 Tax=Ceutorhynchus assimilis TaxID=467358 RepID=A0A9P0GSZ4_9CUCU|nr:unnamed protein product [Ceutorhynchus assimilis]